MSKPSASVDDQKVHGATAASESAELSLAGGYRAALARDGTGACLRITLPGQKPALELMIELTERGPVVRVRAAAIELESDGDISARCERFHVEARESIELVTQGALRAEGRKLDIEATLGAVRVRANDEVQLLGEQVLLNCEPPPPMPAWALPTLLQSSTQAPSDVSGDLNPEALGPAPVRSDGSADDIPRPSGSRDA